MREEWGPTCGLHSISMPAPCPYPSHKILLCVRRGGERQLCAADNKLPSITSSPYCFSHFLCSSTYRAHLPCFNGLPDVLLLCSISAAKAAAAAAHQMNAYKNKTAETAATTKTRTTSALPQQAAVCRHERLRADSSSMFWPPQLRLRLWLPD